MLAIERPDKKTSICCRDCGGHFSFGDRFCRECGKTLTSFDLRAINEQNWADELRALKYYLPASAILALLLLLSFVESQFQ